jgi:Transposase/Helix-turn-helix domain of transposase family ISL3
VCQAVKRERLEWLADNPHFTRRFAVRVGRYCRVATVKDVAEDWHLDWHTVKDLDKLYMQEQLDRIGCPAPEVIGIDELSIGPRHTYRIVVSDLLRRRPIWFGGTDRSEASMDAFYTWLGPEKSRRIRLAVMDMWKAFRTSTLKTGHAPQARIIFDKFHVLRHLSTALDTVRNQEYARLSGPARRFIKGQKYNLLSRWDNLHETGRAALGGGVGRRVRPPGGDGDGPGMGAPAAGPGARAKAGRGASAAVAPAEAERGAAPTGRPAPAQADRRVPGLGRRPGPGFGVDQRRAVCRVGRDG